MNCEDMVKIPELKGVLNLKAGAEGMLHPIRWIYFADCLQCVKNEYRVEDYIHGSEFVVLTNRSLTDDSTRLRELISKMQEYDIAALGINEGQISDELTDYCNEHSLPLFELTEKFPLVDLSQIMCQRLVLEQNNKNSAEQLFTSILDAEHLNRENVFAQARFLNVDLSGEFRVIEFAYYKDKNNYVKPLGVEVQTLFRDRYSKGEPVDSEVDAILDVCRNKKFGRIIAIGGGTVIDIAKLIAVAKPEYNVDDLYDNAAELKKHHQLVAIPTTCGTGSEVTNISVVNRVSKGVKMGLAIDAMLPDKAVMITNMLDSLPYKIFATSSIDAMVHSVESFLSPNGCSISRIFSTEALKTIISCWKKAVDNGGGEAWKEFAADFLKASNWAGLGFGYAGCAAVHACAYPLGSVYHIPHGQSNQLMFAPVMKKYKELQPVGRINDLEAIIAETLGCNADEALEVLYELMDEVLKSEPLKNFGVKESDLPGFASGVIKTQQRLLKNNYIPLTEEQVLDIYKAVF